jgi:hypothetical protein
VKIFGIGLNKTGTSTLHEALETLGFRSLHWGGPEASMAVKHAIDEDRPMLEYLAGYDAYSDITRISRHFERADREYPGSKFVLTVRDLDQWLDSRRRHVEQNVAKQAEGRYDGIFVDVDYEAWTREYREHEAKVRAHFATRPDDLLVFDVAGGDGYEKLCPFLGVPVPDRPFPWRNRDVARPRTWRSLWRKPRSHQGT